MVFCVSHVTLLSKASNATKIGIKSIKRDVKYLGIGVIQAIRNFTRKTFSIEFADLRISAAKLYKSCFKYNEPKRSALANVAATSLPRSRGESV
jgi:hypothetical protein